ncbi:hypothetical protein BGY98DRAFT_944263 [Russula aff. rugulosa BPL654]|nr:hypothetical protein BGY98DRAFT_944263 [Russula aff. rugulosa BPL654]
MTSSPTSKTTCAICVFQAEDVDTVEGSFVRCTNFKASKTNSVLQVLSNNAISNPDNFPTLIFLSLDIRTMEPHASLEIFDVLLFTGWLAWAQAPATRWDLESDPFYVHFGFNWHQSSLPASASIFGYRELNRGLLSWRRIEYIARQYIARQTGILCRQNGVKHLCRLEHGYGREPPTDPLTHSPVSSRGAPHIGQPSDHSNDHEGLQITFVEMPSDERYRNRSS